jgi:uncharacterized membrane protein (DUF2068 family)
VVLVALLNLILAALFGLALSPWDFLGESALIGRIVPVTTMPQTTTTIVLVGIAFLLHAASGIGLLLMKTWAWRLAILITGIGLAIYLTVDFLGTPSSIRLAVYAAIAFYLNTSAVRDAFLSRSDPLSTRDSSYEPSRDGGGSS